MNGAIAVPLLPFFKIQRSSPSVLAACQLLVGEIAWQGTFERAWLNIAAQSLAVSPVAGHTECFPLKQSFFPFSSISGVAGRGFVHVLASSS